MRKCRPSSGSIPACAGNPLRPPARPSAPRVHPRVCGESISTLRHPGPRPGPSPRVRGIPSSTAPSCSWLRSIPACAGNPWADSNSAQVLRVHPRVCGESLGVPSGMMSPRGPSPRVRGIRERLHRGRRFLGSIPACAGNPSPTRWSTLATRVHPRVCGESGSSDVHQYDTTGPSPRVRGIRGLMPTRTTTEGSIPACAGNPGGGTACGTTRRVHPRVCGESFRRRAPPSKIWGPSPRVRGIRARPGGQRWPRGSIPACAGNPCTRPTNLRIARVHPRVCGESTAGLPPIETAPGPSPRVRGILDAALRLLHLVGSIPACAGNPVRRALRQLQVVVHPRVCGESPPGGLLGMTETGPSPRVRGIRDAQPPELLPLRSIPACAGNPPPHPAEQGPSEVHPRVCGESAELPAGFRPGSGPSPRVRGIPGGALAPVPLLRSIPACAGNPPTP